MYHVCQNKCFKRKNILSKSITLSCLQDQCLLDHMEINVTEAEKRANSALNIREYYTVYLIETK